MTVEQVGGDHYQAEYQHWDWVIDLRLGYLEGCATKYVSRHWKKNGVQDLKKARTYVEKLMQALLEGKAFNRSPMISQYAHYRDRAEQNTAHFISVNRLPHMEADFCECVAKWRHEGDLSIILALCDGLITKYSNDSNLAAGGPVAAAAPTPTPTPALPAAGGAATHGQRPRLAHPAPGAAPFGYDGDG